MPYVHRTGPARTIHVIVVATLVMLGGVRCTRDSPTAPSRATTVITLRSDPGDYIGQGQTYQYTRANATIAVSAGGGLFAIDIIGDQFWGGHFMLPSSLTRFKRGMYADLRRFPFHDPAKGGLGWSGDGRGCNTLTGWFAVDDARYSGDALQAIDLRFEQHCEGDAPALHGEIHWTAADRTEPPGPVNPIPEGLWKPPAGATPSTGTYVYLQSDPNDYIGQGRTLLYTPANSTIAVQHEDGLLEVSVADWQGSFEAMSSLSRLEVGYYGDLKRYPFHNPAKGGLDWYGDGRGCNRLTGWFAVDRATYSGDALTAIELRFEQHCERGAPALRGAIRWEQ